MATMNLHGELAARMMVEGFQHALRKSLEQKFTEVAQELVSEAVKAAADSLKATVEGYVRLQDMNYVVKVLVEDRRSS